MASSGNSQELITYKRTAMTTLASTEAIVQAINAKDPTTGEPLEPGDLFYTHIFPYGFLPEVVEQAGTYITVEVSMPNVSTANYFFKDVLVTITIICHQGAMRMTEDEPLGATGATRPDYIAVEIDKLFNQSLGIMGRSKLELVSNVEGALDNVHRCRIMRFQTSEVVSSLCK